MCYLIEIMELNHLKHFYEVARAGSFTKASQHLHVSQSSLSKAVALLEDQQGVKLLNRSKKGVTLTSIGQDVFLKSQEIFNCVVQIDDICRGNKEVCQGPLRFGASDHITNYLLIQVTSQMHNKHPKVLSSLFSGTPNDIIAGILNNELEFGLFFTKISMPGIAYKPLLPIEMVLVCHPKLVPGIKANMTQSQIRNQLKNIGLISSIGSQYQRHPLRPVMEYLGKESQVAFESNSQETQKKYCMEGGGIAFLAKFMVEKELQEKKLVSIPLQKEFIYHVHLAHKKDLHLSLNAQTFLGLLK